MEPWQEMNVLVRRIEAGELDKFLAQIGQAVSRRLGQISIDEQQRMYGSTKLNEQRKDRARGSVLANQAKLGWCPGDIAQIGASAPWRLQDLTIKVLRVNQTTLWCRAVAPKQPDRITGYQWFQGFKVRVRDVRLITNPDTNITRLAAMIPLPGPKLRIGKPAPNC